MGKEDRPEEREKLCSYPCHLDRSPMSENLLDLQCGLNGYIFVKIGENIF